jgi:phage gp29-like protein
MSDVPAPIEPREIATSRDGRDITRGYVEALPLLPPQDSVLLARGGGDLRIYEEIARDDQVMACFQQRRLAVVSREWDVEPGDDSPRAEEAAAFLREQLHRIQWDAVTDKMLWGLFYGYGVGECLYSRSSKRRVQLDAIKVRKQRRFAWTPEMELRLRTLYEPDGVPLPPHKFWVYSAGADNDDEPYGLGLAHWLYWPVFFKRNGIKFWLVFLEKFGQPTGKGTYPPNAQPEERQRLLAALQAIHVDSSVIVPEGMVIELIEAARSGTADYTELHDRMNAAIAKVILGQVASTEGTPGKLGGDDMHMDVRRDLTKADADVVCQSFNLGPARWLTEWNFGPDVALPRVWRDIEDSEDLNTRAERDKHLNDMGFRPTLAEVHATYGAGYQDLGQPSVRSPIDEAAFAAAARRARTVKDTVDLQFDRLRADSGPVLDELQAPIFALLDQVSSMDELGERIETLYPQLSPDQFAELMADATTAAQLAGRYDVLRGL